MDNRERTIVEGLTALIEDSLEDARLSCLEQPNLNLNRAKTLIVVAEELPYFPRNVLDNLFDRLGGMYNRLLINEITREMGRKPEEIALKAYVNK